MPILVWFAWALGLMLVALTTRNPLYLAMALLVTRLVHARLVRAGPANAGPGIARFAIIVIPISAVLNGLTIHMGDTVLFTVPGALPLVGGAVTLESMVYGAINGLMLTTILSIFATLNTAVSPREWMRFAPRVYHSVAMTTSIALGFAPQLGRRLRDVRDAQAIRGHRVRGVRDWLPLWMPLLMGSLEQSMQVSEAMVARGFGAVQSERASTRAQLAILIGLAIVLLGWLAPFAPAPAPVAVGAIALGAVVIVWGLRLGSRNAPHTTYRAQAWTRADIAIVATCASATIALLLAPALGWAPSLYYTPYPALTAPGFQIWIGLALLAFATPALLIPSTYFLPSWMLRS
jgi:energy-coupling factor transport system permease protein